MKQSARLRTREPITCGRWNYAQDLLMRLFVERGGRGPGAKEHEMTGTNGIQKLKAKTDHRQKFHLVETLPHEKFESGHLPGAVNLPPDQIKQQAPRLLPDRNADIVVYCGNQTCTASEDAARELAS